MKGLGSTDGDKCMPGSGRGCPRLERDRCATDSSALFIRIAGLGSIWDAARILRQPMSSVSHGLALVEESVGAALLDRSSHHLRLAKVGTPLRSRGTKLLDDPDDVRSSIYGLAERPCERLGINAPYTFSVRKNRADVVGLRPGPSIEAFTPRAAIDKKRSNIIRSVLTSHSMTPKRISKPNLSSDSGTLHVTCASLRTTAIRLRAIGTHYIQLGFGSSG